MPNKVAASNKNETDSTLGILALGGVALYLATKNKPNPVPSGPTAKFVPDSGEVGDLVAITGAGWTANEIISAVSVGGVPAQNELTVDDIGSLSGTLNIPQLNAGTWSIIITSSVSGTHKFAAAFVVKTPGAATGWTQFAYTTLTITHTTANPAGWVPFVSTSLVVTHIPANPVGWVPFANTAMVVTHTVSNPAGWVPFANATLVVTHTPLTSQLMVTPTTLKTGDVLSFTFYNFTPMASVSVYVVGGGGMNITANALGSGTGSFSVGEGVGFYSLEAADNYGNSAIANFTVRGSGPVFPAPGTFGDGYYWYWVRYADGSIGWDDSYDVLFLTHPTILSGPYASGATG
jgi:hypothetical protein